MLATLFGLCFTVSALAAGQMSVSLPKTPKYYPGDGISVRFVEGNPFTFLWPEKWAKRSTLTFVLVSIEDNQTVEEAIIANEPLYQEGKIKTYYLHYPFDRHPLENGMYAWQIRNENGKILLTTTFRIDSVRSNTYEISQRVTACTYMKERQDGGFQTAYDGIVFLHFTEPYEVSPTQKLRFCIYDSHRNIVLRTDENGTVVDNTYNSPVIHTGENWVQLSVGSICYYYDDYSHDYKDDYYLEVWDSKGEKSFLRFRCVHSMPRLVSSSDDLH